MYCEGPIAGLRMDAGRACASPQRRMAHTASFPGRVRLPARPWQRHWLGWPSLGSNCTFPLSPPRTDKASCELLEERCDAAQRCLSVLAAVMPGAGVLGPARLLKFSRLVSSFRRPLVEVYNGRSEDSRAGWGAFDQRRGRSHQRPGRFSLSGLAPRRHTAPGQTTIPALRMVLLTCSACYAICQSNAARTDTKV